MSEAIRGVAHLKDKVLIPGGPGGNSDKFSGEVVMGKDGIPRGVWYMPMNPAQHARVEKHWIPAEACLVIELRRPKPPEPTP